MITADIPITMISTADPSLSLDDFIEYSIKNDLNIVTTKWLAHTKKITITESRNALLNYWNTVGMDKQFCATFSVLSQSENGFKMKLMDSKDLDKVEGKIISNEIYCVQAVPLKNKSVQLGLINVPIFDLAGEISAPWIDLENFPDVSKYNEMTLDNSNTISDDKIEVVVDLAKSIQATSLNLNDPISIDSTNNKIEAETSTQGPPAKKMKMIKKTRTFIENGYQMTEVVNELVPCDDENDVETEELASIKPVAVVNTAAAVNKPKQQSSMMNFFKKK